MQSARKLLKLDSLRVVGLLPADFPLADGIHAKSLDKVIAELSA